jgi:hypothetical protein
VNYYYLSHIKFILTIFLVLYNILYCIDIWDGNYNESAAFISSILSCTIHIRIHIVFWDLFCIFQLYMWDGELVPNIPLGSYQHAQLDYLVHDHFKFLKEKILLQGKVLDDCSGVGVDV